MKKPCSYCGNLIPDSGIWGLPTYTDVPENHKSDCPIREIMEVNIANNASQQAMEEPNIIINGRSLSQGASMTIRVAIEHFAIFLSQKDCLGNDETGRGIREGYIKQIGNIRQAIMANKAIEPTAEGGGS